VGESEGVFSHRSYNIENCTRGLRDRENQRCASPSKHTTGGRKEKKTIGALFRCVSFLSNAFGYQYRAREKKGSLFKGKNKKGGRERPSGARGRARGNLHKPNFVGLKKKGKLGIN